MSLKESENNLIEGCLKNNRRTQKCLYENYAPKMINVCLRYCGSRYVAEEAMQDGFIKVYNSIGQLKDPHKLGSWIKKIMINSSLMKLRKKERLVFYTDELLEQKHIENIYFDDSFHYNENDLEQILNEMPKGYKVIFSMYVHDDFSHKEIAKMLEISESTSKSQLSRARNYLKSKLIKIKNDYYSKIVPSGLLGSVVWVCNNIF